MGNWRASLQVVILRRSVSIRSKLWNEPFSMIWRPHLLIKTHMGYGYLSNSGRDSTQVGLPSRRKSCVDCKFKINIIENLEDVK